MVVSKFKVMGEMMRRFELSCCALLAEASLLSEESLPPVRLAFAQRPLPVRRLLRSARNVSMLRLKFISPPERVMNDEDGVAPGVTDGTKGAEACPPWAAPTAEGVTVMKGGGLGPELLMANGDPEREPLPPLRCW